jgi:type I restriction enzyme S subunit
MKWEEIEFETVHKIPVRNGIYKTPSFHGRGERIINMKELFAFEFISDQEMRRVELETREKDSFLVEDGDLLFGRRSLVESGSGKCSIVRNLSEETTFESSLIRVRLDQELVCPLFYYYYFKSSAGRGRVLSLSSGTNVKGIRGSDLKKLEVIKPPLPTQRKIASILSAYDDLIENNLKRIKLLEEKAFLRYKQIVKDEKMEVEDKLENLIQTVKRKAKIPKADFKEKGDFPIIDQSTDFIGGYTNEKEVVYEDLPMIVFGDHTRILKYINFPFACGADGTQLVKPNNPSISVAYLYFELISCNLSNYHYARHFKFLKEQVIKLPSEKVMVEYKEETDKIFNLIQLLRIQNTKLREARDILLPKLMNGQIEV